MNPRMLSRFGAPVLLASFLAPSSSAGIQAPTVRPAILADGVDADRVFFDAPGDGGIWACGEKYKMSFDASGATYYPRLGRRQPQDAVHRLSPDTVSVGGVPIPFDRAAMATLSGDRVSIDRGAFVETYELEPHAAEQSFIFSSLPRTGDLVLHIPVASEFDGVEAAEGLEFRGALATVKYSRAVAIDAHGRRSIAPTRLEGGAITIRIDGAFLREAAMPLTIDPVISHIDIDTSSLDTESPDVAWDPEQGVWLAAYEVIASSVDADVFVRVVSPSGNLLASGYVDMTTASWAGVRVANLAAAQQFLVVAEVTRVVPHYIRGRTVEFQFPNLVMGPQFDIAAQGCAGCSAKIRADVGGDPSPSQNACYCVVYEEDDTSGASSIACRLVRRDGTLVGAGPTYLADSAGGTQPVSYPSISKSIRGLNWLVAWVRSDPTFLRDIWAAYVRADGSVAHAAFGVTAGDTAVDLKPSASSPLDGSGRAMIAFTRGSGNAQDTMLAALDGTTVLQILDLSKADDPNDDQAQIEPAVDSDGRHFVVVDAEFSATPGYQNYQVRATDVFLVGSEIVRSGPSERLRPMAGTPTGPAQRRPAVSAQHDRAVHSHHYFALYDHFLVNAANYQIVGEFFDALDGGLATPFCFGDGTGEACPCGNIGSAGHGCANSVNPAGGLLAVTGTPSTVDDTLVLTASGMPSTATCLFVQGSSAFVGAPYGDGIRCFTGTLIRLGMKTSVGGSATYPSGADPKISVRGAVPPTGAARSYQAWYRNPPAFCTSGTSNVTNGVLVTWAP